MKSLFRDDNAVTVIFGTLMIIMITIVVATGVLYFVTMSSAQYEEEQSLLAEQKSENLEIISLTPCESDMAPDSWTGFDFTVHNRDINDAEIRSIVIKSYCVDPASSYNSFNDKIMTKRVLFNESGGYETQNGHPNILNDTDTITVPAEETVKIHVGAFQLKGDITSDINDSVNFPKNIYPNMSCSGWYNITDSTDTDIDNGTFTVKNNNFSPSSLSNGNVTYTIFPDNEPYDVSNTGTYLLKDKSLSIELLTNRKNTFSKVFAPPIPIVDMQHLFDGKTILLDGSGSSAPNGFITNYRWAVNNSTSLGENYTPLYGMKTQINYEPDENYTIDLTVTDNYGMSSNLSDPLKI